MTRVHHSSVGQLEVITIASGVPWKQNCHLIAAPSQGRLMIIDPGAETPELNDAIRALGLQPDLMVVTHGHPDHLGAAARLCVEFDLECLIGVGDQQLVGHAPAYAAAFGKMRLILPQRIRYIDAGTDLTLGDELIAIQSVPGHTPGSLAFRIGGIVATGDTIFRQHVGRTDFPGSDMRSLVDSVDSLLSGLPEATQLLPGHGRPWTAGEARDWWASVGRKATDSLPGR